MRLQVVRHDMGHQLRVSGHVSRRYGSCMLNEELGPSSDRRSAQNGPSSTKISLPGRSGDQDGSRQKKDKGLGLGGTRKYHPGN